MFEINRREVSAQAKRLFKPRMETDSWGQYKGVISKIISIIYRTKQQPRAERPPYTINS